MDFNAYSESSHDSTAPSRIAGLSYRRTNESTGAKEYELLSGVVIEVSPDGQLASSSAVTRQSEKSVEQLAIEKGIGTNPRSVTNNKQERDAQRREYQPPGRAK